MPHTGHSTIARRLTNLTTLVSGAALLLACVAFGIYDRATSRTAAVRGLSVQAQIVGANSVSALLFNDPQTATDTLAALDAAPAIVSADIYAADGTLLARYQRDPKAPAPAVERLPNGETEIHRFGDEEFVLVRRVVFKNKPVGSVAIRSSFADLMARRTQYVGMVGVVLVASLIAAALMSWLSQRRISAPVVQLADVAQAVSRDRDYSVRAPSVAGTDEIAVLTRAFNDMLGQIERRDNSLHDAQHALEARVTERTAELQAVNAELEAFSYSVSHDLRAPLRHVTGFASLLEKHAHAQLDDKSRGYLKTITQAATRMGQLIDDLLAFSRIGRGQLVRQPVCLNDIVREARHEVAADASRTIAWQIADLPDAEGDPAMLRLVMINLVSNAVKYSSTRAEARIEIGSEQGAPGELVVFVRDNGVGFDMQYAQKLFGVFQRLHSSDQFDGTGIGLANVKRIIQRHGGRVWAEGALDRGATFYFSLPAA